jgi:hypothetical protein
MQEAAKVFTRGRRARTGVGHVTNVQQVRRARARVGVSLPMPERRSAHDQRFTAGRQLKHARASSTVSQPTAPAALNLTLFAT